MDKIHLPRSLCSDPLSIGEETEAQEEARIPRLQGLALGFLFSTSRSPTCGNTEVWRCGAVLLPWNYDHFAGHCVLSMFREPVFTLKLNVVSNGTLWSSGVQETEAWASSGIKHAGQKCSEPAVNWNSDL